MSCSEIRSLLSLRALDLLEEADRLEAEAHLASCGACRLELEQGELARDLASARRDERPPERVFEALVAKLDAGAAVAAAPAARAPLLDLACATCQGGLTDAVYCASCLAPHHAECFTTCTVTGCQGTKVVSARRSRGSFALPLVVGLVAIGGIAFVQNAYEEQRSLDERLVEESLRNAQLEQDLRKFIEAKKPALPAPKEPARPAETVSIRSEDEPLGAVLDKIGQQCGQNLVVEPDVHAKVTVTLHDAPWRDAVSVIAQFAKCDVVERGNVLVLVKKLPRIDVPQPANPQVVAEPARAAPEPPAPPPVTVSGIIDGTRQSLSSVAVINDRTYREGDEVLGRDKKPLAPRVFLVKIRRDEVELATGSPSGPRTVLAIGH